MNDSKNAAVVGAVVFISVLTAIVGAIWLSGAGIFSNEYHIFVEFDDVSGLGKGTSVSLSGTKIGRVSNITVRKEGTGVVPVVEVSIERQHKIPEDSKFMLVESLLEKAINIRAGESTRFLSNGAEVQGEQRGIYDAYFDISKKGGKALDALFTPENIQAYTLTIREMSKAIEELRKMIIENRKSFAVMLANMEETSGHINQLFRENRPGIQNVIGQLTQSGESFGRLVRQSDSLVADMADLANKVNKGEGTLGKLVVEDTIYNDIKALGTSMRKLTKNLNHVTARSESLVVKADSLIVDIKKNPRKYLKISIF